MMMARSFQVHPHDNVATLLDDVAAGAVVQVLGAQPQEARATEAIARGHKIALVDIAAQAGITKFGACIGFASISINLGGWVHLHNLTSSVDQRSGTLDLQSGAPNDIAYV